MQKIVNMLLKKKQSAQRIEDMANNMARAALSDRVTKLLALQAIQPTPQGQQFEALSNPIQMQSNP